MAFNQEPPPGRFDEEPASYVNGLAANDSAPEPVMPHDLEAEAAVVSAVLLDPQAFDKVKGFLRPEHFYSEAHRRIHEACVELSAEGKPVDVVQVATWLRGRGRLAQVGGMAYLTEVLNAAPAVANVEAYGRTVHEKWRVRQMIAACKRIAAQGYTAYGDASTFIDGAVAQVTALQSVPAAADSTLYGAELAEPLSPISWLCSGLRLTSGAPTVAAGNSFAGKSLAWTDVAVAVAMGADAFGSFRCRRGRSLMLDYDGQGQRISQDRLQRIVRSRGADLRDLGKAIGYARRPGFYLDDADAAERLLRLLDGVDLCVIDSWRGATPATDEWRRGPVQAVGERLEHVSTKTGCVIVIINHTVKPARDGASNRSSMHDVHGSSAKAEMAQALYAFEGEEGKQVTRVKHAKERVTGQTIAPFGLRFEDVERDGDPRWGLRVMHVDREEVVRNTSGALDELKEQIRKLVLKQHDLRSKNAICERIKGGSKSSKLQAIVELLEEGLLTQPGGERTPFYALP